MHLNNIRAQLRINELTNYNYTILSVPIKIYNIKNNYTRKDIGIVNSLIRSSSKICSRPI